MNGPTRLSVVASGTVYREPTGPQGYYPRVVRLTEQEWLASFVASVRNESPDSHPFLSRSADGGARWTLEGPIHEASRPRFTETGFLSLAPDGTLYCLGSRWARDAAEPDRPLVHPTTIGMAPNDAVLRTSTDGGRRWTDPVVLPRPYPVPLEVPTGPTILADGTMLFTCSTWREWDGSRPYGHRVTSMRSTDRGRTWTGPIDIFHDPSGRLGFWECRVAEMPGGLLVATCWAHDWQADADVANRCAFSRDGGRSWGPAGETAANGQTGWPLSLGEDRLLFVYNHRRPPVGVRAQIAALDGGRWRALSDDEVWSPQNRRSSQIVEGEYAVTSFQFGAPSALRLSEDRVLVVYWCVVDGRAGIGWSAVVLS